MIKFNFRKKKWQEIEFSFKCGVTKVIDLQVSLAVSFCGLTPNGAVTGKMTSHTLCRAKKMYKKTCIRNSCLLLYHLS